MRSRSSERGSSRPSWAWWLSIASGVGLVVVVGSLVVRSVSLKGEASRLKLIDDFSSGTGTNLVGGKSVTVSSPGSRISSRYVKVPTAGPRATTLALDVQLAPEGSASWTTSLHGLDISAATHLSFWIRIDPPTSQLTLELVDQPHHTDALRLGKFLAHTPQWQHVRLSLQGFPRVDLNQLDRLRMRLRTRATPLHVTIMLDDLAFEGPKELFFNSLRDNLHAFPTQIRINADQLSHMPPGAMLRLMAADTWGYFRDLTDTRHHLPVNSVQLAPERHIGDYTSPTDIALYLLSVLSAYDLNLINREEALQRVQATLTQLSSLASWHHFFYNYYSTTNLQIARPYISSVDNGWLAAALVVLRQAMPEVAGVCTSLLTQMDFGLFYDEQQGQMRLGYDTDNGAFAPYHYGLLASEARMLSLVAIGKRDVPEQHWFRIYRTLPKEWNWQRQVPQGTYRQYRGYDVFEGHYTYEGVAFVPSWGGSLFEFLMPTLVLRERELAPQGLGLNDQRTAELHMRYALKERRYPVWGLAPSATPNPGSYAEFGVAALGAKGYEDHGVVTPYSSVLALELLPEAVIENIRQLLKHYPIYGEYGLYDAVDVKSGRVAYRYLALDQGMILIAINNYLNEGIMRKRWHADPIGKRTEWLLETERFF